MKNAQKNYLDKRLNEVKSELVKKIEELYKVQEYLDQSEKIKLILSGEVTHNKKRFEDMLRTGNCWAQWHEVYDFSVQEKELQRVCAPMYSALKYLDKVFVEAKDTIMLGSESEALAILHTLQELDLKNVVKNFPPVEPAKKAPAKKKAKR